MILLLFRIAIVAASCAVPRDSRAGWRRAWISRTGHYALLLRTRGVRDGYVRARIWRQLICAMRDAGRLLWATPGIRQIRSATRRPGFCLALIALGFAAIIVASRGLSVTRAMLNPPYADASRLVLISEAGILPRERRPIPPPLLTYWKAHATTLAGLAGYRWNARGTACVAPDFFEVLGTRPRSFLLRPIADWRPLANQQDLGVVGRLKPGATPAAAQKELRDLASGYWRHQWPAVSPAQVAPLVARTREPLYAYGAVCASAALLLLAGACVGMRVDRRRIGRIRPRYWAYFCIKSIALPLALALVIWEFSRATSFTPTGDGTFADEPIFVWLVILACGATVWWCLADQRARCRACLQVLQYPVRIGSLGAVLFDPAGTELVCCEGHGVLYLPAVSSDYVQRGGWTALDAEEIDSEPVPR